jgi:hypothetical protein
MTSRRRIPREEPKCPVFKIFLCTKCGLMDENFGLRSCPDCQSSDYIARYLSEPGVTTWKEAFDFYIKEIREEVERKTKILNLVHYKLGDGS